jgi:hypothetical protein
VALTDAADVDDNIHVFETGRVNVGLIARWLLNFL